MPGGYSKIGNNVVPTPLFTLDEVNAMARAATRENQKVSEQSKPSPSKVELET